ncbi:hypothetical protein PCANC_02630 [Puccinia coronata f. sp. avenae]|uniref:Uncharacterized protein n=1 Tax=Puccinia coronata f. sp. avenae TaxID=200324 RepID=A0A2N5W5I1_9BASI|nr:hypothetical protein PCANC_02630 [Puccinia coronata f. sp. avenae]
MNNWDLQSNRTASGESDLSISEWFNHPITPPSKRHVPQLFDGTAHLVKKRDCCREAFLQITGQKSTVSGSSATNLLPLQENLNPTHPLLILKKWSRPQNAPPPPPKTKKVQSESNKIGIDWPFSSKDLEAFKAQVWFVTVPNNHMFAANRKQQLESDSIFEQFVAVSSKVKDNHKISCCLVQKDPRVIDERESAFIQLRVAHGDRDPLPPKDPHPEPTEGAVSVANVWAEAIRHHQSSQPNIIDTSFFFFSSSDSAIFSISDNHLGSSKLSNLPHSATVFKSDYPWLLSISHALPPTNTGTTTSSARNILKFERSWCQYRIPS